MALGSENMVYHQQPTQYHQQQPKLQQFNPHQQREVLRTRNVNHQRSIAPAPYTKPSSHTSMLDGTTLDSNNPSVIRRNARERSRVKQVNDGFSTLRKHIPTSIVAEISNGRRGIGPGADKKLSKVDTLRMAAEYIRRLKNLIDEVDNSDASSISTYPTSPSSVTSSSYASSTSGSPPPPSSQYPSNNNYYHPTSSSSELPQHPTQLQYCPTLSYVGTFHQHQLISPANSCSSAESYQNHSPNHYQSLSTFALNTPNTTPIKFEPASNFDDYHQQHHHNTTSSSNTDDEELLDYISLWQDQ